MRCSRPRKLSRLAIIHYEIRMLRFCEQQLRDLGEPNSDLKFAVLEAFLLHYRNVVEFLGWCQQHRDDLRTVRPELWAPEGTLTEEAQNDLLWIQQGFHERFKEDHTALSKYLQHITSLREVDRDWDVDHMQTKLKPFL